MGPCLRLWLDALHRPVLGAILGVAASRQTGWRWRHSPVDLFAGACRALLDRGRFLRRVHALSDTLPPPPRTCCGRRWARSSSSPALHSCSASSATWRSGSAKLSDTSADRIAVTAILALLIPFSADPDRLHRRARQPAGCGCAGVDECLRRVLRVAGTFLQARLPNAR